MRRKYYETSFINVDYSLVLDFPEHSNMEPFRYLYRPSGFIGWGYDAVPGRCLQAVLVVVELFFTDPFSTFTIAGLLIVIFKICLIDTHSPNQRVTGTGPGEGGVNVQKVSKLVT